MSQLESKTSETTADASADVDDVLPDVTIPKYQPSYLIDTRKYANIWSLLKSQPHVILCLQDATAKATIVRGISQLKNLDSNWKFHSEANYHKRLRVTEIKVDVENKPQYSNVLYLKLELYDSFKYRSNSL